MLPDPSWFNAFQKDGTYQYMIGFKTELFP
jgi:hypothetical protein